MEEIERYEYVAGCKILWNTWEERFNFFFYVDLKKNSRCISIFYSNVSEVL